MEAVPSEQVDVTEDIDVSALLDPRAYFSRLDDIEEAVIVSCQWRQSDGFSTRSLSNDAWSLTAPPKSPSSELPGYSFTKDSTGRKSGTTVDSYTESVLALESNQARTSMNPSDLTVLQERRSTQESLRFFDAHAQAAEVLPLRDVARTVRELELTVDSLQFMQFERVCRDVVNIVVDTPSRSDIVQVVDLSISDIEALLAGTAGLLTSDTFSLELLGVMAGLLAKFDIIQSTYGSDGSFLPASADYIFGLLDDGSELTSPIKEGYLDLLSAILSLAVRSYVGSHCVKDDAQIVGQDITSVQFDNFRSSPTINVRPNFRFQQRQLACFDTYLGSKIWTFGTAKSSLPRASLICSIEQLADLWGPVFAVPSSSGQFTELLSLNLEGGILHRTPSEASDHDSSQDDVKHVYDMHFTPTGPVRRSRNKDGIVGSTMFVHTHDSLVLPPKFIPFLSNAKMLIGGPSTFTSQVLGENSEGLVALEVVEARSESVAAIVAERISTEDTIPGLPTSEPRILTINHLCPSSLSDFRQAHALDIHLLGTAKACYLPENYQVNFGGGQWVSVGVQKSWKQRPASTYKTMLVEMCSKPRMKRHIHKILDRRVGLEWSLCTGNAERRTLWEMLKYAFPTEATALDVAYTSHDTETLAEFITDLSATGLDEHDSLRLFWPTLEDDLPHVLILPSRQLPKWSKILRDTTVTACFAVASSRCLVYDFSASATDVSVLNSKSVTRGCSSSRPDPLSRLRHLFPLSGPTALATTLIIDHDALGYVWLGRRLRLDAGLLKIRTMPATARDSTMGAREQVEWRLSVGGKRVKSTCRELLHENDASRWTLKLRIAINDKSW